MMEGLGKLITYIKYGVIAVVVLFVAKDLILGPEKSPIDLGGVLDRTVASLTIFQKHLTDKKVEKATDEDLKQLPSIMNQVMNHDPAVYSDPVGIKLLKDASFEGFSDENKNNIKDGSDSKLFTVELDFDNNRLIATGTGGRSTGMGMATGLMAGMLMGRLMGRQRGAGVKSGAFNNRKVQSRSNYARARARSGGRFGGK